jgi:hypothetical protein
MSISTANTALAPVVVTPGGSDFGVLDDDVAAPGIESAADGSRPSVGCSNDGGTLDMNITAVGIRPFARTRADGCCILAAHGRDIAALYNVETKVLNQAVKRNIKRFPEDFMFQLSNTEFQIWKSQIVTSNSDKMGLRRPPYAFTENGVSENTGDGSSCLTTYPPPRV